MALLHAQSALDDAHLAFDRLERCTDELEIRIYWVAATTLARTAFDVLDKVDRHLSVDVARKIDDQWERVKANVAGEHDLFWSFLKIERDMLVHQYKVNAQLSVGYLLLEDGGKLLTENGDAIIANDFFLLHSGKYQDQDGRDVLRDALSWVQNRIDEIAA